MSEGYELSSCRTQRISHSFFLSSHHYKKFHLPLSHSKTFIITITDDNDNNKDVKRSAEDDLSGNGSTSHTAIKTNKDSLPTTTNGKEEEPDNMDIGEFEDPYGDEFESDEEIIELDDNNDEEDDDMIDENSTQAKIEELEAKEQEQQQQSSIYLPHKSKPLGPDEVLEADPTVYEMLHNINLPWPCLTVDILPDSLGNERRSYPATVYLATATQAAKAKDNELLAMKASSLAKTLVKDENEEDEEDEDDDDDVDSDPILDSESIPLRHTTNRIRVSPHAQQTGEYLTASMSENGEVYIFDLLAQYKAFDTPGYMIPKSSKRPIHTIRAHGNVEGYGLDWSPLVNTGALLSGDMSGRIYLTNRTTSSWTTDKTPFLHHNLQLKIFNGQLVKLQCLPRVDVMDIFVFGIQDRKT